MHQQEQKKQRFTLKKLTIGVASVLLGMTFMAGATIQADSISETPTAQNTNILNSEVASNTIKATTNENNQQGENQPTNSEPNQPAATPNSGEKTSKMTVSSPVILNSLDEEKSQYPQNKVDHVDYTFQAVDALTGKPLRVINVVSDDPVIPDGKIGWRFNSDQIGKTIDHAFNGSSYDYIRVIPQINGYKFTGDLNAIKNTIITDKPTTIYLNYTRLAPVYIRYIDTTNNKVITILRLPTDQVALTNDATGEWKGDNYITNPIAPLNLPGLSKVKDYYPNIPGYAYIGQSHGKTSGEVNQTVKAVKKGNKYYLDWNPVVVDYDYKVTDSTVANYSLHHPQLGKMMNLDAIGGEGYMGDPEDYTSAYNGLLDYIKRTGGTYVGGINTAGGVVTYAPNDIWYFFLANRDVKVNYINKATGEIMKTGYADRVTATSNLAKSTDPNIPTKPSDQDDHNSLNGQWTTRKLQFKNMIFMGTDRSTSGHYGALQQEVNYYYLPEATKHTETKTVNRVVHYVSYDPLNIPQGTLLQPDVLQQITLQGVYYTDADGKRVSATEAKDTSGKAIKDGQGNPIYVVTDENGKETWSVVPKTLLHDVALNKADNQKFDVSAVTGDELPETISVDWNWSKDHGFIPTGNWYHVADHKDVRNVTVTVDPETSNITLDPVYITYMQLPTTPDKSTTPSTPSAPDKPTTPSTPSTPNKSATPGKPSTSNKPTTPNKPNKPDKPSTSDKPSVPSKPTTPSTPSTSGKSTNPSTSSEPRHPSMPVIPTTPTGPSKQTTPSTTSQPSVPLNPAAPSQPGRPTSVSTSTSPLQPSVPVTPSTPVAPTKPSMPSRPNPSVVPTKPEQPTTSIQPSTIPDRHSSMNDKESTMNNWLIPTIPGTYGYHEIVSRMPLTQFGQTKYQLLTELKSAVLPDQSAGKQTNDQQTLPQTGNDQTKSVKLVGLAVAGLAGMLSLTGLKKKKQDK